MRDAIEMAREAGFMLRAESVKGQSDWWECFDEEIQKLVALAREDERGETNRRANASWSLMCEKMVAAEREAIIDLVAMYGGPVDLEAAIRARGQA